MADWRAFQQTVEQAKPAAISNLDRLLHCAGICRVAGVLRPIWTP